jgi:hypothetical protein
MTARLIHFPAKPAPQEKRRNRGSLGRTWIRGVRVTRPMLHRMLDEAIDADPREHQVLLYRIFESLCRDGAKAKS